MSLQALQKDMRSVATAERAKAHLWFFKTAEGEYGYGDKFLGLTVPQSRAIARKYKDIPLPIVERLLQSEYHEERLVALIILVGQFGKGVEKTKKDIYNFYLSHTKYINNWDLVDLSAEYIVGEYLYFKSQNSNNKSQEVFTVLQHLATSESVWERRIAVISTFAFIKHKKAEETFAIAEILLQDKHDLIQKAVGWMLREVGKRVSQEEEEAFLKKYYKIMPRTMLRYAIERFTPEKRKAYLIGVV